MSSHSQQEPAITKIHTQDLIIPSPEAYRNLKMVPEPGTLLPYPPLYHSVPPEF